MVTIAIDGGAGDDATVMPSDLHLAVQETYRQAMTRGRTKREAFDLVVSFVLERQPQPLRSARRSAGTILANEPYLLPQTLDQGPPTGLSAA
jgi:hypothetical protein